MPSRGRRSCCAATTLRKLSRASTPKSRSSMSGSRQTTLRSCPISTAPTSWMRRSIEVGETIFQGIGLVLVVLILFLGSVRSALIIGITIPFAMFTAFILMNFLKIPANLLSLGAIDFGIIVDGAIVMTEAILRRREADPDRPLTEADVAVAAHQVARPILFATLIIISTYLPLFAFQRVEAKLFYPMAYAVGFAQLGALLHSGAGSRPCLDRLSPSEAHVSQPGDRAVGGGISQHAATLAATAGDRLHHDRACGRSRDRAGDDGVARISAGTRRRLNLAPC